MNIKLIVILTSFVFSISNYAMDDDKSKDNNFSNIKHVELKGENNQNSSCQTNNNQNIIEGAFTVDDSGNTKFNGIVTVIDTKNGKMFNVVDTLNNLMKKNEEQDKVITNLQNTLASYEKILSNFSYAGNMTLKSDLIVTGNLNVKGTGSRIAANTKIGSETNGGVDINSEGRLGVYTKADEGQNYWYIYPNNIYSDETGYRHAILGRGKFPNQ
jgi:hypothetical protein